MKIVLISSAARDVFAPQYDLPSDGPRSPTGKPTSKLYAWAEGERKRQARANAVKGRVRGARRK